MCEPVWRRQLRSLTGASLASVPTATAAASGARLCSTSVGCCAPATDAKPAAARMTIKRFMAHLRGVGVDVRAASALHRRPYAAYREPALCGPVRFRPASGARTREGVMRCPYHGPMPQRPPAPPLHPPPPPFRIRPRPPLLALPTLPPSLPP